MRPLSSLRAWGIVSLSLFSGLLVLILPRVFDHSTIRAQDAHPSSTPPAQTASGAKEGELCLGCHTGLNPALTQEWRISAGPELAPGPCRSSGPRHDLPLSLHGEIAGGIPLEAASLSRKKFRIQIHGRFLS